MGSVPDLCLQTPALVRTDESLSFFGAQEVHLLSYRITNVSGYKIFHPIGRPRYVLG